MLKTVVSENIGIEPSDAKVNVKSNKDQVEIDYKINTSSKETSVSLRNENKLFSNQPWLLYNEDSELDPSAEDIPDLYKESKSKYNARLDRSIYLSFR